MRSRAIALLVVVLGLAAPGLPPTAAAGCAGAQRVLTGASGAWTTYAAPGFSEGPAELTAHAVDPAAPSRWWATNGVAVARSLDGGCTWDEVFVLPQTPTVDVPASRQTDRIGWLAPAGTAQQQRLVLAVEVVAQSPANGLIGTGGDDALVGTSSTVLLAGAEQFRALGPLAAPLGAPGEVRSAPSDPRTLYAIAGGVVNASSDGGSTWRVASPAPEPVRSSGVGTLSYSSEDTFPGVSRLAVDPRDPQAVWVRERGRVHASTDGGASYEVAVDVEPVATLPLLGVARPEEGPARVVVGEQADAESPLLNLRISDGQGFQPRSTTPGDLGAVRGSGQSLALGPRRTDLVLTTTAVGGFHGVYVYVPALEQLVAVDEFRLGPLSDVQRAGQAYAFRTTARLVRWVPDLQRRLIRAPALPTPQPIEEFATDVASQLGGLSDATRVRGPEGVVIPPGQTRKIPLTLELAPEPTPIDVFFLLDTSGSMDDVIDGLADGFEKLADDLADRGYDARYGLGDYQDTGGVRYRRLVDLSPADGPLRDALAAIETRGGAEPAYTALHQIATGSGVRAPRRGQPVPKGEGTSWRPGSLRVVVHATDEVPSADADGADRDTAVEALQADRTRHVGIEVVRDTVRQVSDSALVPPGELNDILSDLARDTEALAPVGGVDCDADGDLDVVQGEPLVCELVPGSGRVELAGPLERVLSSLVDEQPVGIAVGPRSSVTGLDGRLEQISGQPRVNVKRAHVQEYSLTLTCPAALAGTSRDLRLRPQVGIRTGLATTMRVTCAPLPAAAVPPMSPSDVFLAPAAAPVLLVPALPPLPLPPPAPVAAPAPAAAPAALPAAAPGTAPLPAVAVAPGEEQVEVVLARQEVDELAMVDRRERPDLLALRLLAMATICGVATAGAVRRTRAQVARRTR